jgi:hypothetical protein
MLLADNPLDNFSITISAFKLSYKVKFFACFNYIFICEVKKAIQIKWKKLSLFY